APGVGKTSFINHVTSHSLLKNTHISVTFNSETGIVLTSHPNHAILQLRTFIGSCQFPELKSIINMSHQFDWHTFEKFHMHWEGMMRRIYQGEEPQLQIPFGDKKWTCQPLAVVDSLLNSPVKVMLTIFILVKQRMTRFRGNKDRACMAYARKYKESPKGTISKSDCPAS
ncbi:hypothetical protein PROFUN_15372, partial [Planoprotostelium fungivorum]